MNKLLLLSVIFVLSIIGCSPALNRAASDMESSKAAYKACLQENQTDTSRCDTLKTIYQVDIHNYKVIRDEMYWREKKIPDPRFHLTGNPFLGLKTAPIEWGFTQSPIGRTFLSRFHLREYRVPSPIPLFGASRTGALDFIFQNVHYYGMVATTRAFLKYLGNRKWIKLRKADIALRRPYLIYLGNRTWKKDKHIRAYH